MEFYRGDNKSYTLAFTDSDNNAIDITGWKIFFTIKQHLSQSDSEANLKEDVTDHDDPTNGLSSIHLSNGQTDLLEPGDYFSDIQVKKTDGTILTIMAEKLRVLADVTRRES